MKFTRLIILLLCINTALDAQQVETLGIPLKSSNLLWNFHPASDAVNNNIFPFFTKKLNGDVVSILVDLKTVTDNGIATGRFSLVTVNTSADNYNLIDFASQDPLGTPGSYGNPWIRFEGPDKKIYISTVEGGGHLLQYDVEQETAIDLGSPFIIGNRKFGIYSMAIGSDSAIYGGSYSNNIGDTYAFRYDPKTNNYWKYLLPIDKELQYVSYAGGDAENTYVICGQSTWNVYAINRNTNSVKKLLSSATRIYGIENTPCGCYITVDGNKFKLSASAATPSSIPAGCIPLDFTYTYADSTLPKTYWDEMSNTYYYQHKNTAEKKFVLNVPLQDKKIRSLVNFRDSIIVGNGLTYSFSLSYNPANSGTPIQVGNNKLVSVYSVITLNNKVYLSGYPSGALEEWDPTKKWTYGTQTLTYDPPPIKSPESNPSLVANYRHDGSGIHQLYIAGVTNNGHIIVTGNNIRTDTSVSIGTYKNGVTQQLINPVRFKDYVVKGQTISFSGKTAYILAQHKNSWQHWVYEYDPEQNNVIDSFTIFTSPISGISNLIMLPTEELFGEYIDAVGKKFLYTYDITSKQVTWRETFSTSSNIFCKLGTDEQVWFSTTPISPAITVFKKFNPYTKEVTTGPSLINPDKADCTVTDLVFFKKDLYIGGYLNLIRIPNVVEPIPANLSAEQKVSYIFNTYKHIKTTCD